MIRDNFIREYNAIILPNNKILWNYYGKYKPNLTIIIPRESEFYFDGDRLNWIELHNPLDGNKLEYISGRYYKSKFNKDVFEILPLHKSTHKLYRLDWGGYNSKTRGILPKSMKPLYQRRAASNSGKLGYTYFILSKEEEIEK